MGSFPRIRIANANVLRTMMVAGVLAGLALFHGALALSSLRRNSPTIDEVAHLPAGITYWQKGTFALFPHNPPLVKLLAALPVLASNPQVDYSGAWARGEARGHAANFKSFGAEFLHSNPVRFFDFFIRGRSLLVVGSLVGLWFTFLWARQLWGSVAGLLAAAVWSCSPNVLAHAGLVTMDVGAMVSGFVATYFFWRWLRAGSWKLASAAGLGLGIAQLTKFSNLILYGLWPCMFLAWWLVKRKLSRFQSESEVEKPPAKSATTVAVQGGMMVALSVFVINAGYAFEGTGQPLGNYEFLSGFLTLPRTSGVPPSHYNQAKHNAYRQRQNRFRGTLLEPLPVPLPKYYVVGIDELWFEANPPTDKAGYFVYLRGELRQTGWWYYYLYAMAVKVPVATWLLLLVATALGVLRANTRARPEDELALVLPPVFILFFSAVFTDIDFGVRYVLPVFPYLFVAAGRSGRVCDGSSSRSGWLTALVAGAVVGNIVSAVVIWPHYLSFFNLLAGGPENGHHHLIDSNLDWGQDLFEIERWLEKNPQTEPIGLAYFGTVEPRLAGIDNYFIPPRDPRRLPDTEDLLPHEKRGIQPGLYAISVNLLQGLPFPGYVSEGRLVRIPPYTFSYFRQLKPVARAGYSIWIFRVGPEEAKRLNEVLLEDSRGHGR